MKNKQGVMMRAVAATAGAVKNPGLLARIVLALAGGVVIGLSPIRGKAPVGCCF